MFCVAADSRYNALVVTFEGIFDSVQAGMLVKDIQEKVRGLKKDFLVFTDMTDLERMDKDAVPNIEMLMQTCDTYGAATVVRIIPQPDKDIGFNIMSKFHYSPRVKIYTCRSRKEAHGLLRKICPLKPASERP
ncbi:MAG: hypothetical protein NC924_04505 [Candidatus Omnitrophica bacterium]|nr:hypothetical protein [Candidatus Omnitrophota bacterium]